ncbi:MAG: DNRLRE domain-containing protein, partial [Pseudomonadales bacterium]|nr:DNRLRE domain-containing protein [Pseudomonadales bacterium]
CGDDTGENVARTVNVQHDWNGQVGFGASANYFLNCGESDGGGTDGGGEQPQNLTLTSTADAYVDVSAPNQNFGSDAAMLVDLDPNELHSYLKFDVPELTASLESATLRVYGTNASPNGPRIYTTGNNWSEGGITWNNKPSPNSDVIADTPALSTGWIEIDVTDAISGSGQISFVMIPDDNDGFDFESREAANQPELVIITGDGGNNGGNDGGSNGEDSANGNSAMNVGERLYSNEYLVSSNGLYRFYLQSDGNLVLRDWQTRDSLWSSKTHNQNGVRLSLQSDSNLVLYTGTGAPVWASNTVGAGADRLVLNDDGSLALYQGNSVVWSVNGDGGNNGGGDTGGGDTGGNGNIQHIGTNETYDSNGQGLRISRPSGSQTGDLLVLALHRTDDYLPLRIGGGWTRAAECLKRDNGYDCVTYDDCSSWLDGDFCESFGDYGRGARDLAQAIFYKRVGSSEPSSYTFDMNPDTNGHPGWAILTALRGANTSNPIRDWANEGCDNNNDSLFPSVYAQSGDMVLLSQSFDDAVAQNKFGAPTGTSTFGYVSQSDEAGFLYGGIVDSTGETGSMKTHGDGASGCKDALISLSIRSE